MLIESDGPDGVVEQAVTASGARGVVVGHHSVQVNLFGESPGPREVAGPAVGGPAGRPLAEVTSPFALEVHPAIDVTRDGAALLPELPAYVERGHDRELALLAGAAAGGASGIGVLVGGSSTGKTRACWEALEVLRRSPRGWRLWHPVNPSRPDAALRDLPGVGPWTVVWLNEAQFYLGAPGGAGERVAAGLRELLRDPARGPVLVLATLWPEYWGELTRRPAPGGGRARPAWPGP